MLTQSSQFHSAARDTDTVPWLNLANPGCAATVSTFLATFRHGITGGPFREELDPSLIDVVVIPGTSAMAVLYSGKIVAIAHRDQFDSVGMVEVASRFIEAVRRFKGRVSK